MFVRVCLILLNTRVSAHQTMEMKSKRIVQVLDTTMYGTEISISIYVQLLPHLFPMNLLTMMVYVPCVGSILLVVMTHQWLTSLVHAPNHIIMEANFCYLVRKCEVTFHLLP